MHKKSIEAAETLNSSDDGTEENKETDDLKSESIASLRAKAQEHHAKLREDFSGPALDKKDSILLPNSSSLHKFESLAHIADSINKSCVGNHLQRVFRLVL